MLEELDQAQEKLEKLNVEAAEETIQITKKYNQKKIPFYKQRAEIVKKIPNFWATTLLNHSLSNIFNEDDRKILEYLQDLEVEDDDVDSFIITMRFKPNPWFTNEILRKHIASVDGEPEIKPIPINWKEGKDPSKKGTDNEKESFFDMWFISPSPNDFQDQIAEIIRDEIWPNPGKYYRGVEERETSDEDGEGEENF